MKKLMSIVLAIALAGCATVTKVEGDQVVNNRLAVRVTESWNKMPQVGIYSQPFDTWTQDGPLVDHLRMWAGVHPGEALIKLPPGRSALGDKAPRVPTFAAGLAPDQLVNLFELAYAADGSRVKVTRIDRAVFAGEAGVRFEFQVTRKHDDLHLDGVGWAAVRNNELFAATFVAPELSYFKRLLPKAQSIVATARIKG
jgi:hypothetical protein